MAEALFDSYGRYRSRLIDSRCLGRKVVIPDYLRRSFNLDYAERYARFRQSLYSSLVLPERSVFVRQSEDIFHWLKTQPALAPLMRGIGLPVAVPRLATTDYGCFFESLFLGAAKEAYRRQYPQHCFDQQLGPLGFDLRPHPAGRHERLVAAMVERPLVGIFFPWAFHGVSPTACRELMAQLPTNMLLAGGIDTALALVGYSDVLVPDALSPDLATPGIQHGSDRRTVVFQCWGKALRVNDLHAVWEAGYDVTSGLFVMHVGLG